MKGESHEIYSWPSILVLELNSMSSEARKHLSCNSWKWVQHSSCGGVTTEKL